MNPWHKRITKYQKVAGGVLVYAEGHVALAFTPLHQDDAPILWCFAPSGYRVVAGAMRSFNPVRILDVEGRIWTTDPS
jgi:hypothetical protein